MLTVHPQMFLEVFLSREASLTVFRSAECSCRSLHELRFDLNIQMIEDILIMREAWPAKLVKAKTLLIDR